jgi:heme-degrading monooxygenase HmoA
MTHSILTIPVRAGQEAAFLDAFVRLDVFGHAARIPGFGGGELLRPVEDGDDFVVHARWETPEGYQAWLDAPVRAQLVGEIGPYVEGPMTGRLYTAFPE